MTAATATDTRHIRDVLPLGFIRELQGTSTPQSPPHPEQPPSSIKGAIIRWLNAEL